MCISSSNTLNFGEQQLKTHRSESALNFIIPSKNTKSRNIHVTNMLRLLYYILHLLLDTCEDPTPANGQVNASGQHNEEYIPGTTVSFMCDTGYRLDGSDSSTCQTSGTWDPPPPTCLFGKK